MGKLDNARQDYMKNKVKDYKSEIDKNVLEKKYIINNTYMPIPTFLI